MIVGGKHYRTVWLEGSTVKMIDQHKIPEEFAVAELADYKKTAEAIKTMVVRGAGATSRGAGRGSMDVTSCRVRLACGCFPGAASIATCRTIQEPRLRGE